MATLNTLTINLRAGTVQGQVDDEIEQNGKVFRASDAPTLPLGPIIDAAQTAGRRTLDLEDLAAAFGATLATPNPPQQFLPAALLDALAEEPTA